MKINLSDNVKATLSENRAACVLDIEKSEEKDYNMGVAFH